MTTRNSPPPPPIATRNADDLLEELGLALRDVAVVSSSLPVDPDRLFHINRVKAVHAELTRRGVDIAPLLATLTQQTAWLMESLLDECLRYPASSPGITIAPEVRDADGIRHWFRCPRCQDEEIPDKDGIWLCNSCLAESAAALRERRPLAGLVVVRSYTPEKWCAHADADTVLVAFEDYDGLGPCYCSVCLTDERRRRARIPSDGDAPTT